MKTILALALGSTFVFFPLSVQAMSSGEMQAEWARHGFKHGAWDCNGACPEGRRRHKRYRY